MANEKIQQQEINEKETAEMTNEVTAKVEEITTETATATEEVKSSSKPETTKGTKTTKRATKTSGKKPVEKSAKTLKAKSSAPAPEETTEEEAPAEETKATTKSSAKPPKTIGTKKPAEKKPLVAKYVFPEEMMLKGIGKMSLVPADTFNDFEGFAKLFEDMEEASVRYVVAFYTPKSMLKDYDTSGLCKPPKQFENDLDIFQVRDIDPEIKRVHLKSVYTMAFENMFEGLDNANDFESIEVINKFKTFEVTRTCGAFCWNLYEITEADESEEEVVEE